jgi:hypothetical protein
MDNRYQDEINTWAAANNVLGRLAAIEAAVFPVDTGSDKPAGPAPTADFSYDQGSRRQHRAERAGQSGHRAGKEAGRRSARSLAQIRREIND